MNAEVRRVSARHCRFGKRRVAMKENVICQSWWAARRDSATRVKLRRKTTSAQPRASCSWRIMCVRIENIGTITQNRIKLCIKWWKRGFVLSSIYSSHPCRNISNWHCCAIVFSERVVGWWRFSRNLERNGRTCANRWEPQNLIVRMRYKANISQLKHVFRKSVLFSRYRAMSIAVFFSVHILC